jgi:N-methylhydantoinase A
VSASQAAPYTVDIDIGGTLTDGVVSDGQQVWTVKVDTTPHDFTVCLFDCLREGAQRAGFDDLSEFLGRVSVIRWAQTIATNVLAERKGPRIGLLVDAGHEQDLYGGGLSSAIGHVVSEENITGVANPGDFDELLKGVRRLLEHGVRRVCVSFGGAFEDDSAEQAVHHLIDEHFPDHFLGAVPSLLGSEICRHPDDQTRTHMALINAYVHTPMAVALFKAEDELLEQYGYRRPLYIAHVNGGVSRVAKTKAIETLESGPVFGLVAAAHYAHTYGLDKVVSLDVGGTTAKIGVLLGGRSLMAPQADFFGIRLKTPWVLLRSAALGGGSIARARDGRVTLGPESQGAYPGPACYDLGGEEATLTDCFLIAGMLDPERFLEGRRHLDVERARDALEQNVAGPLGMELHAAADAVIEAGIDIVEETINRTLEAAGLDLEGARLFCFGGNGGNFAGLTAERMRFPEAYVFAFGPVLSAYGASVSSISHVQEEWPFSDLSGNGDYAAIGQLVSSARERVLRDLEGEGLGPEHAKITIELTVGSGSGDSAFTVEGVPQELSVLLDRVREHGTNLVRLAVRGTVAMPHADARPHQHTAGSPEPFAMRDVRGRQAACYDWDQLGPGDQIRGPAMLETGTNTVSVPPGFQLRIDEHLNGIVTAIN